MLAKAEDRLHIATVDGTDPSAAPVMLVAPADARPLAAGDRPRWMLMAERDELVLTLDGRPPVRLSNQGWQDTPFGRRLTMMTRKGGIVTLTLTYGLCRSVPGTAPGSMIATLAIGEMRLRGCFDGGGGRGGFVYPGR